MADTTLKKTGDYSATISNLQAKAASATDAKQKAALQESANYYKSISTSSPTVGTMSSGGGISFRESPNQIVQKEAVITPESLKQNAPELPTYKETVGNDMNAILNSLKLPAQNLSTTDMTKTPTNQMDTFLKLQEAIGTPPSSAEAYKEAQRETGILEKQQKVNDLTSQLNQITTSAQANQLAITGQGRGIPEAIIGGQQAQIAKEAAIQALPVSAQLQAAQGNLEMAQQNLNTLFQIKSQDLTNQYNYKKDLVKGLWEIASAEEKRRLDKIDKLEDRKYQEGQDIIKSNNQIALEAAKHGAGSATLNKIYNAKTVGEAISVAGSSLVEKNIELREFNGGLYSFDRNTGRLSLVKGGDTGGQLTGAYGGAIETILGSGKFTKDQAAQVRRSIQNGEEPVAVIKNQAKSIMTGANQTKVENYETAKGALQDIQSQLKEFYARGGKTNIFNGTYEKAINKLGTLKDQKLVDLATQIQANLQVYRNAVSGTAYSVQEGKDIASIFPGINKTEGLNNAILSGRMKAFDSTINSAYSNVLGQNTWNSINNINQSVTKGNLSDSQYIEKIFNSSGQKYDSVVNSTPKGQIPVIDNASGQIGYLPIEEYLSSSDYKIKYTRI